MRQFLFLFVVVGMSACGPEARQTAALVINSAAAGIQAGTEAARKECIALDRTKCAADAAAVSSAAKVGEAVGTQTVTLADTLLSDSVFAAAPPVGSPPPAE